MITSTSAASAIKTAMSNTRSRLAAITINKLEAIVPGNNTATIARLRRLNTKSSELRRVGKRSLHDRLFPRKRPLIARIQEFRALKYWVEYDNGSIRDYRDSHLVATDNYVPQDATHPCLCCTEYGVRSYLVRLRWD